jgi:acyl-CoA hydrolase
MIRETISSEQAASFVKSGMWLDYGATHCQPDVFDKALAARKDELENVKIRSCLSVRPRAVIEQDRAAMSGINVVASESRLRQR